MLADGPGLRALGLGLALAAAAALSAETTPAARPGHPPGRTTRPEDVASELHRLRVVNRYFGAVSISRDGGASWERIGRVLRPVQGSLHMIQDREFTAADWAPVGSVAATAVNAMHLKLVQGRDHAGVVSLLPRELETQGPTGSYRDSRASIVLDLPAGSSVFGELAPRVGDPVLREDPRTRETEPWPAGRAPELGDRLVVLVRRSPRRGGYLEIENRWGGLARWVQGGREGVVARVYRPVTGSGRFGGTVYQRPGRVRANHPGVLCVSTSPVGERGGFQIIPSAHANEPSLSYVVHTTAYLVLGPAELETEWLEGRAPIFLGSFRPGDRVEARVKGVWGPLPEVSGKKASGLVDLEVIRVHAAEP